jgi:hypothetical protein
MKLPRGQISACGGRSVVEHLPGTRETLCLIICTAKEKGERERERKETGSTLPCATWHPRLRH